MTNDDLDTLLRLALDSADEHRLSLIMALCLTEPAGERETELARITRDWPPPVFAS